MSMKEPIAQKLTGLGRKGPPEMTDSLEFWNAPALHPSSTFECLRALEMTLIALERRFLH